MKNFNQRNFNNRSEKSTKKSGFVIELPKNRAKVLHQGNYIGEIMDYDVRHEDENNILYVTLSTDEGIIKQRIFMNFDYECPFIQLLDFFEISDDENFNLDSLLGLEIGFRLKQKGDYLNISKIFPPEDIMNYGNQVN